METPPDPPDNGWHGAGASRRIAQRLLVIFENRIELLTVELQAERERVLRAILLAIVCVAFGLLTGVTVTIIVAIVFWKFYPVIALLVLLAIYLTAAIVFYSKLARLQQDWQMLGGTLEQLKKDRECLEKNLK